MELFYYIISIIISWVFYVKIKILNFSKNECDVFKLILIIPFLNVIIMFIIIINKLEHIQELEGIDKTEDDNNM